MTQPSSYRHVVAACVVASSLALVATAVAPTVAGASSHKRVAPSNGVVIRLEKSKKYGSVLADGAGRSLYFLSGSGVTSLECTGGCTSIWPPLLTKKKPHGGEGVDAKMLGTVKRGSSLQATYDGHPLYRFAGDTKAGQVNGELIHNFGGTWYLLGRKGAPVRAALSSHASGASSKSSSGASSKSSGGW